MTYLNFLAFFISFVIWTALDRLRITLESNKNTISPEKRGAHPQCIDRVLFSSRPNWDLPAPSPAGECAPPPGFQGEDSIVCGRGGGSQFGRGDRHYVTLGIYVLFWRIKIYKCTIMIFLFGRDIKLLEEGCTP
jgi:hypothetical protein